MIEWEYIEADLLKRGASPEMIEFARQSHARQADRPACPLCGRP